MMHSGQAEVLAGRWRLVLSRCLPRLWLLFCLCMVLLPLAVILSAWGSFDAQLWAFLLEFQLPLLLENTFYLLVGVGLGVVVLGTSSAWLTAMYRFPLQRFFFWAMMLPLAMPAYVLAFTQLGLFDYTGPVSTWLRETWAWEKGLPEVRNGWGLVWVMSLTFYPYVYLLARNAFAHMGQRALEAGASLGLSPWQSFYKLALPMARPWIAGGAVLALMETLADFGTVSVFGYDTFTTAIYQAWFDFYSLETAKQLAALLIIGVFVLLVLEQYSRGARRFHQAGKSQSQQAKRLSGGQAWLACAYCGGILLLAFGVPVLQLVVWAYQTFDEAWNVGLWQMVWHSFITAMAAAWLTGTVAVLLAVAKRADGSHFARIATRIATLGYAVPGTVLAVGVFVPVAHLDNWLIAVLRLPEDVTGIFKGTLVVMLLALTIRFLAVAYAAAEAGLERVSPTQAEAARTLGCNGRQVLWRVYLPLMKGASGTAVLMTFVDVMKEMPITLMTRPYDWDTLSARIYAFTSEGQYMNAALPALLLVATGLLPVIVFSRTELSK